MIELRWLVKREPLGKDWQASYKTSRVLQYRTMENTMEIGIQPPIWSEWRDVEEVEEKQ